MSHDIFLPGDRKTPIFSQVNLKNYCLKLVFHCYLWGISRFNHLSLPDPFKSVVIRRGLGAPGEAVSVDLCQLLPSCSSFSPFPPSIWLRDCLCAPTVRQLQDPAGSSQRQLEIIGLVLPGSESQPRRVRLAGLTW